jgi:hypothetical protein
MGLDRTKAWRNPEDNASLGIGLGCSIKNSVVFLIGLFL